MSASTAALLLVEPVAATQEPGLPTVCRLAERWTVEERLARQSISLVAGRRRLSSVGPCGGGSAASLDIAEVSRLLRLVLEVLDRRRPLNQLDHWLPRPDRLALEQAAEVDSAGPRRLRTVRPSVPAPGVVEVCATVRVGARLRAMVGRFERGEAPEWGWQCALLRMV